MLTTRTDTFSVIQLLLIAKIKLEISLMSKILEYQCFNLFLLIYLLLKFFIHLQNYKNGKKKNDSQEES